MPWTAEEARYALDALISLRKIRLYDVERALSDRKKEIQRIREKLADLEVLGRALGAGSRPTKKRSASKRSPRRRKAKLSARTRSQLRLQGKYMGYVRRLTATQKAEVRKVRLEKGWREAIRMAAGLAKETSTGRV